MTNPTVRRACVAAATLLAIGTAACGQTPPPANNQQDVMFAQMMIPHHQQAITMSDHELSTGQDPQVKELAAQIKQAQGPEIARMQGWLSSWGAPAHHGGMGGMDAMMSSRDMTAFQTAHGPDADHRFLEMMISHHQGAIDMAHSEQSGGADPSAKDTADSIAESQQAQIGRMHQMLGR